MNALPLPKSLLILFTGLSLTACNEVAEEVVRSTKFEPAAPQLRVEGPVLVADTDFAFVDSTGKRWLAPTGTKTDGATIPRWALSVVGDRMDVSYRNAALIHDAYCQGGLNGSGASYHKDKWQNVHRMFYEACVANGVEPSRARLMFSAVWMGGPRWDENGVITSSEGMNLSPEQKAQKLVAVKEHIDKNAPSGPAKGDYSDLTDLMELMTAIEQDVKEIKATTAKIDTKTDRILAKVEDMSAAFASLSRQGGVIADPQTPEQHYHNARFHELGGDYGNARRSYLAYFGFDLDYLDPHLRFLDFLKLQEGRAGAREAYQVIVERAKSIVPRYASLLLWERDERIRKLEAFLSEHPDFAPGYYHLSEEFSAAKLGTPSLDDKKKEKQYLEKFLELAAAGKLMRWFIDQEMVSAWLKGAEDRLTAIKASVSESVLANPVEVRWMPTNAGWMGNISVAEAAREIFWKGPGMADFKSTGFASNRDPRTGEPMPQMTVSLSQEAARGEIAVKYTNAAGASMGPYTLLFDPASAALVETKHILDLTRNSWVSFRDWDGKLLLYFSHLLSHRGALREIRYGLDRDQPDQSYPFPPTDQPGVAPISDEVSIYTAVPLTTQFVTVQVIYRDGSSSEMVRVNRR